MRSSVFGGLRRKSNLVPALLLAILGQRARPIDPSVLGQIIDRCVLTWGKSPTSWVSFWLPFNTTQKRALNKRGGVSCPVTLLRFPMQIHSQKNVSTKQGNPAGPCVLLLHVTLAAPERRKRTMGRWHRMNEGWGVACGLSERGFAIWVRVSM